MAELGAVAGSTMASIGADSCGTTQATNSDSVLPDPFEVLFSSNAEVSGVGVGGRSNNDVDIDAMTVGKLRQYIIAAGLSHHDCLEKQDLRQRAREAAGSVGAGNNSSTEWVGSTNQGAEKVPGPGAGLASLDSFFG